MGDFVKNIIIFISVGLILGVVGILILNQPTQKTPIQLHNSTANQTNLNQIEIIHIRSVTCTLCRDTEGLNLYFEQSAQKYGFAVGSNRIINYPDSESSELIRKYRIDRLPTIIVREKSGNLSDAFKGEFAQYLGSVEGDGTLVMRNVDAPYLNISENKIVGLAKGIAIYKKECAECLNASKYFQALEGQDIGMVFLDKKILEAQDTEAKNLIMKYNITKLPTLILDQEAYEYGAFNQYIANSGEKINNTFVIKEPIAPFFDLEKNETAGLVNVTIINPINCTNCTNISNLVGAISVQGGIVIDQVQEISENETTANELIGQFNITKLPTMIFSKEMKYYSNLQEQWIQYGNSVEEDGEYVLRSPEGLSLNWTYVNSSLVNRTN